MNKNINYLIPLKPFRYSSLCLFALTCLSLQTYPQKKKTDSLYIRSFEKTNSVELYPGIYHTTLNFKNNHDHKNNFKFVANSSGYLGAYVGYNWLSLNYSVVIPGSKLDKNVKLKYQSFVYNFNTRHFSVKPFYDAYNGLLKSGEKHKDSFEVFREIQTKDAGVDFVYFTNIRHFSYNAANSFSEQQLRAAGAFLFAASPMWQRFNWRNPSRNLVPDSSTYTLLTSNPEWFSLVPKLGYTYNFVLHNGLWSVAPELMIGSGAVKELNPENKKLQITTDIQAKITAGYNGPRYYIYLNGYWDKQQTNLFIKNLRQINTNVSITAGYRFKGFKKKILGVL